MAFELEDVVGVSKEAIPGGFRYSFQQAIIETNSTGNYFTLTPRGESTKRLVRLIEIADTLGASTIDSYVDQLAIRGYYSFTPVDESSARLGDGSLSTNFEANAIAQLQKQTELLEEILFILKGIAE